MRRKLLIIAAIMLVTVAVWLQRLQAQSATSIGYFNNTNAWSQAAEICHIVPALALGTGSNLALYGVHASNTSASAAFVAIFPGVVAQPGGGTVIPGGGWAVAAHNNVDINTVQLGINNSSVGFTVCLSTTAGTFTATTAVGYFWGLYVGNAATPTPTPT